MKIILEEQIIDEVSRLCIEACTYINKDVLEKLNTNNENEQGLSKTIIGQIIENDNLAKEENIPMCQDTGICVVFVELGNEVYIKGDLNKAINEGVSKGYTEGYLRKSVVRSPLRRINTNNNTPAIIHIETTLGDNLKITVCPKGAGSENMSQVGGRFSGAFITHIKKNVKVSDENYGEDENRRCHTGLECAGACEPSKGNRGQGTQRRRGGHC